MSLFTPPSRQGVIIPFFFRALFFLSHLPQTPGFRWAKQILVASFATQARACILTDRKYILHPQGKENNGGVLCPWGFSCLCCLPNQGATRGTVWLHGWDTCHVTSFSFQCFFFGSNNFRDALSKVGNGSD